MIDSSDFAIPLAEKAAVVNRTTKAVNVNAAHYFWFGRRLWLPGLGLLLQGAVLIIAGVFLLTQMTSTPNLVVQIAITGSLLTLGGVAMLYRSMGDFMAGVRIDRRGIRVQQGWTRSFLPWSNVECWTVQEPKIPQLPAVTLWLTNNRQPVVITGVQMDEANRREIHEVLRVFACGKETD